MKRMRMQVFLELENISENPSYFCTTLKIVSNIRPFLGTVRYRISPVNSKEYKVILLTKKFA